MPPAFVVTVSVYELPTVGADDAMPATVVIAPFAKGAKVAVGVVVGDGVFVSAVMTPTVLPDVSLIMMLFIVAAGPAVCSR